MTPRRHGPDRQFDPDEIERYARYREQRAAARPAQCTFASPCWVEDGPPAMTGEYCRGCNQKPVLRWPL